MSFNRVCGLWHQLDSESWRQHRILLVVAWHLWVCYTAKLRISSFLPYWHLETATRKPLEKKQKLTQLLWCFGYPWQCECVAKVEELWTTNDSKPHIAICLTRKSRFAAQGSKQAHDFRFPLHARWSANMDGWVWHYVAGDPHDL